MAAGVGEGFVEADGLGIRYMEAGEGPALARAGTSAIGAAWSARGLPGEMIEVADCHHYAVLEQLARPGGVLAEAWRSLPELIGADDDTAAVWLRLRPTDFRTAVPVPAPQSLGSCRNPVRMRSCTDERADAASVVHRGNSKVICARMIHCAVPAGLLIAS